MSPRTRIFVIVGAAAAVAVAGTILLTAVTASDKGGSKASPLAGVPPLVLDLGVRIDPEAKALRRAEQLYNAKKKRGAAGAIFARYESLQAQVGEALASWPDGSLARLEQLAEEHPRSSLVLVNLGWARFWAGKSSEAVDAWRNAEQVQPDSPYAQRADDAVHLPNFPPGQPIFVPGFSPPGGLTKLSAPAQLAALARMARSRNVHAKLLYGVALQRLGHRVSAHREYDAAARIAPRDPETQVAAAVARFDKDRPAAAFSRLGPLTKRFPHAATVRYHLGLLLLWLAKSQPGSIAEGRRQLRLAQAEEPGSPIAREATRLLRALEK